MFLDVNGKRMQTGNTKEMIFDIKTLVSYHPAFLLRSPQYKKEAWNDLHLLQKEMNLNAN